MTNKKPVVDTKNSSDESNAKEVDLSFKRAERNKVLFSKLKNLAVTDPNTEKTPTYTNYTKTKYRTYISSPKRNASNLRDMSKFLYRISNPYKRILKYYADIPLFRWNLTPIINDPTDYDKDKILADFMAAGKLIENMNPTDEFRKIVSTVFRDGAFYGFIFKDDASFFIQSLPADYCRITEIEAGCYNIDFNFSYFTANKEQLAFYSPIFTTMYEQYQKDNIKWMPLNAEDTICIKGDKENLSEVLPLFLGIFEGLIDLIDARSIQRAKDIVENYKLMILKIPFFDNSQEIDDFKIELDTALDFYNKLIEAVPENVGVGLSPLDVETVDFKNTDNESSILASSTKNLFDDSGVSQMLFNSSKSGSIGLNASIKTDISLVWEVVESIERWVRRYLQYNSNGTDFHFEILPINIFNTAEYVSNELKLANAGVPNKLKLAAASGIPPHLGISSNIFEEDILGLSSLWKPLQSSYTASAMSGNTGAPVKDDPSDSTIINQDTEN